MQIMHGFVGGMVLFLILLIFGLYTQKKQTGKYTVNDGEIMPNGEYRTTKHYVYDKDGNIIGYIL